MLYFDNLNLYGNSVSTQQGKARKQGITMTISKAIATATVDTSDAENTALHGTYTRILKNIVAGLQNNAAVAKRRAAGIAIASEHIRLAKLANNAATRAELPIIGGLPAIAYNNTSKGVPCREYFVLNSKGTARYPVHAFDSGVTSCYCDDSVKNDKRYGNNRQCRHGQAVLELERQTAFNQ